MKASLDEYLWESLASVVFMQLSTVYLFFLLLPPMTVQQCSTLHTELRQETYSRVSEWVRCRLRHQIAKTYSNYTERKQTLCVVLVIGNKPGECSPLAVVKACELWASINGCK